MSETTPFLEQWKKDAKALHDRLSRHQELRAFVDWVESWTSQPVGAYSVYALAGLFSQTREKILALRRDPPGETRTDLDCIDYAVQATLLKCRRENPNHMQIPPSGETVMEWFAAALREARSLRTAVEP